MARSNWRRALGALTTLAAFVRCVPLVTQDGLPCPCSGEYRCCEAANVCVREDSSCPGSGGDVSTSGNGGDDFPSSGAPAGGALTSGGMAAAGKSNGPAGAGGEGGSLGGAADAGGAAGGAAGAAGGAAGAAGGEGGEGSACNITPSDCSGYPRKSNVLLLIYNPVFVSGEDVRESLALPDARALSVRLSERLRASSGGMLNYDIVEAREIRAFPPQRPGTMPLDEARFWSGKYDNAYVNYIDGNTAEGALNADYGAIFDEQQLCSAVQAKDISEIWLWGAHSGDVTFGFESFSYRLAGDALPEDASDADRALYRQRRRNIPDCGRTLFLLGAQYTESEAAVGNAHRSYNHRAAELIQLALRTRSSDSAAGQAAWSEFSQTELGPAGSAQVGTPMYPPNAGVGVGDGKTLVGWDYANMNEVLSGANRWLSYPDLLGASHALNCTAWNCSNEGFQSWYSQHVPRRGGVAPSGSCANWWQYVADPEAKLEPCCGSDCHPPAPLGSVCAYDDDCASGHCACAGTAVCVAEAPGPCPRTGWSLCDQDADCMSGVCGCLNGGPPPKKCLPKDYSRFCSVSE